MKGHLCVGLHAESHNVGRHVKGTYDYQPNRHPPHTTECDPVRDLSAQARHAHECGHG